MGLYNLEVPLLLTYVDETSNLCLKMAERDQSGCKPFISGNESELSGGCKQRYRVLYRLAVATVATVSARARQSPDIVGVLRQFEEWPWGRKYLVAYAVLGVKISYLVS